MFTHLHVHTQYSILDGAADIETLIKKAIEYKMPAIAITDHGNMFGVYEFFDTARKNNIKPIVGCEVYVSVNNIESKSEKEDRSGYHLILLAKNFIGYQNLLKLCSIGYKEGFYYTPRVDKNLLRKYKEGLIACSACIGGEIARSIIEKGEESALKVYKEYKEIYGDDFYLELQNHGIPEQKICNNVYIKWSKEYDQKIIATNDVHYVNKDDAEAHDILVCLNTGKDYNDTNRLKYTGFEYLRSIEEMQELFFNTPEAISNTLEIVEKIEDFSIEKDVILPVFKLPENFDDPDKYLEHLTYIGAEKLYAEITPEIRERIDFELATVKRMGFAGYFLIVQDLIQAARDMDVAVGPGRGSAAGSVVAYCIGITNVDPIRYKLLFERFLNPDRISMPDIDIDFDEDGRQKVIDWVVDKYGEDKVAQIITFGTMAAKMSIRDVARVLSLPLPDADYLAKLVPKQCTKLKEAFKEVPELKEALNSSNKLIAKTLRIATQLEGSVRQTGVHACGIIIGPDSLINYIPLSTSKESSLMVTQYEGKYVESAGMLKMDFLGLKTLSLIKDTIKNVKERLNITIDIENVSLEDTKTYELYQKGDTVGTFQFESEGMRKYLQDLKPSNIEDLIAMNALYRPGPMDNIPSFIKRKHGIDKVEYPHEMLTDILKDTYGIMIYQEQIMQISQVMAGFTKGEADGLRKAMGKKVKELIDKLKSKFVEGSKNNGVDEKLASSIYDTMAKFGEYGFNRSHAAAYSLVAFKTAYLKANYLADYMAAVLSRNINDIKKVAFFTDECLRMNIPVLGPCINESNYYFVVNSKEQIRFGIGAIKGVGENAVNEIVDERKKNGHYKDIFDFIKRVNLHIVSKKTIEGLVLAGAFDVFADIHRAQYFCPVSYDKNNISFIEYLIKYSNKLSSNADSNQISLFGEVQDVEVPKPEIPKCTEWSMLEILEKEKEITGFYISGHPLDRFKLEFEHFTNFKIEDFAEIESFKNKKIAIAGMVSEVKKGTTKNGKPFASFNIEDYTGSYKLALFSDDYAKYGGYLIEGAFLYINGVIDKRFKTSERFEFIVSNIQFLNDIREKLSKKITLIISLAEVKPVLISKINELASKYIGKCELNIVIEDNLDKINIEMPSRNIKFDISNEFFNELKQINLKYKLN